MPELVEVYYFVEQIKKKIGDAILRNIIIQSGKYSRKAPVGYDKLKKMLPLKIIEYGTKGKFIYIKLEDDVSIWITLGLTGELLLEEDKHSHLIFQTNNGNFYFDDPRNFGTIKVVFSQSELDKKLHSLGPDPMKENLGKKEFIEIMRKKKNQHKEIANAIVDQKVIAGIGNYLRAEILYHARINPFKEVKTLSDDELGRIWEAMNMVISASFKEQMSHGLHTYNFAVYGRKETPKGEKVEHKDLYGRTIWYVPSVQK